MNLIRRVWLPPDGDSRLVRFQEELARRANRWEWTAVPPFVHLDNDVEIPVGPVETGSWLLDEGQPVLQALDSGRVDGSFSLWSGFDPSFDRERLGWVAGTAFLEVDARAPRRSSN